MKYHRPPESLWILKHCSETTRLQFLRQGTEMTCSKGQLCLRAREDNSRIFFLLSGKVCIYNLTKCGKRKILFVLGPDHIANETLAGHTNTIFCETIEPCQFFVLRRDTLLSLMEQDFSFTRALLQYQERKIWRLEHQLKNTMGSIYLERKLASKLWKLARDFGIRTDRGILIDMNLSITFLADLLGAPRETTSRVCKKLSDHGLIAIDKKQILLPDPEKVAHFYKRAEKL